MPANQFLFRRPAGLADGLARKEPALPRKAPGIRPKQPWVPRPELLTRVRRDRKPTRRGGKMHIHVPQCRLHSELRRLVRAFEPFCSAPDKCSPGPGRALADA